VESGQVSKNKTAAWACGIPGNLAKGRGCPSWQLILLGLEVVTSVPFWPYPFVTKIVMVSPYIGPWIPAVT
jgi:hypothetical protein